MRDNTTIITNVKNSKQTLTYAEVDAIVREVHNAIDKGQGTWKMRRALTPKEKQLIAQQYK